LKAILQQIIKLQTMPTYELAPAGNKQLKKTWTLTMMAYYTVIIAVFAYNLIYKSGSTLNLAIFACIIAALAVGYVFGRKKYYAIMDSTQLIVNDDNITMRVLDRPDITIAFKNIKQVTHRKDGIYLTNKLPKEPSLLIINKFDEFYAIEKLVNDKVSENQLQAAN
jgi:hypothetical protein